jgi:hypothetical protein
MVIVLFLNRRFSCSITHMLLRAPKYSICFCSTAYFSAITSNFEPQKKKASEAYPKHTSQYCAFVVTVLDVLV